MLPLYPSFLFSCSVCEAFLEAGSSMENSTPLPRVGHHLPAKQRGSDEPGELIANSCHQRNGQAPVCQKPEEENTSCSLKTHSKSPNHNSFMPVQPCSWVCFLQRAVGLRSGGEEKRIWRRKPGISDAERDTRAGEAACSK